MENNDYGLAAKYDSEEKLIAAARAAREAGYRDMEAYSPFPVEGIDETIGSRRTRVQWAVFFGGIAGGIGGFLMQYIANVSAYPLNIGGRPFNSWPAFIPISFELTILIAALSGFAAFLISCRLPEVYHPMLGVPGFGQALLDRFYLCIRSDDGKYDRERTRTFLETTGPEEVHSVFT